MADGSYVKQLVVARLRTVPPNVSFSIGSHGDFTRDQLIEQVERGSVVGKAAIDMELTFLKRMPKLASEITRAVA